MVVVKDRHTPLLIFSGPWSLPPEQDRFADLPTAPAIGTSPVSLYFRKLQDYGTSSPNGGEAAHSLALFV
jgi:hypothetical protein